jgi:hypothetical protein
VATPSLKEQLLNEIDRLSPDQQQQMLDFAKNLIRPRGVPARLLLKHAGRIPLDDIKKMEEAIEECEKIDLNEW